MTRTTRARVVVCRFAALALLLLGTSAGWSVGVPQRAQAALATDTPIQADAPIQLDRVGQITDKVNALGNRRDEVTAAVTKLDAQRGIQLFVAYVRDFSGKAPGAWANETATQNGLGQHEVLLAIATHARQYGYSTVTDSGVTPSQLALVASVAVEPALRQNDWAGAAIGAANGIGAVVAGLPVPTVDVTPGHPDPTASSSSDTARWIAGSMVVVGAIGAAGFYAYSRSRRPQSREPAGVASIKELDASAKHALVEAEAKASDRVRPGSSTRRPR